jgi:hypothetical protein
MKTVAFPIGGMHCVGCVKSLKTLLALLALAGCAAPGPGGEAARRAEEAQAAVPRTIDCERLGAAIEIQAQTSADASRIAAPLGSLLKVQLQELHAVSPLLAPGRKEKSADRFAGLLPFRVEASGTYSVLVASLAWADLGAVNPPRLIEPLNFMWVTVCGQKFKSGLYALEPGRLYFVQFWDSPDRELALMIQRQR